MSQSATSAPSRVIPLRPLEGLNTALFVHTVHLPNTGQPRAGVEAIRELLDQDGIGVVYTIPRSRGRLAIANCCVDQTRRRSPGADILLDAALHTGSKQRKLAADGIENDPLSRKNAVVGLVSVLRVDVPVAVLRCDMSVLGAGLWRDRGLHG